MKDITAYLKEYGFFFPSAEIYQGLAKSWDCGPNGAELKRKLKDLWWKYFITSEPNNVGSDSSILTHPKILVASGHLKNFYDWLIECLNCRKRHRLDKLLPAQDLAIFLEQKNKQKFVVSQNCPNCGRNKLTSPRQFNLLLSSELQITNEKKKNVVYLRPETCQGIFVNFTAIQRSSHKQLPFGVGQIGKSFRNEITLRHGVFRTREFEQMELEFFCEAKESEKWWGYWNQRTWNFLTKLLNDPQKAQKKPLTEKELPHYARKTTDLYFCYHFGEGELCSISDRGSYDLISHNQHSEKKLKIKEPVPNVIEISLGVERSMLAILEDSYQKEEVMVRGEIKEREMLKLSPLLAPYFVAIIPLPTSRKDEEQEKIHARIQDKAYQLYLDLLKEANFSITFEKTNYIGDSYRRQDAIGTYYCLTVDDQTLKDNTLTLRYRDTMKQERKFLNEILQLLNQKYLNYYQQLIENTVK
jgi:glycyl-tRNA synthetase